MLEWIIQGAWGLLSWVYSPDDGQARGTQPKPIEEIKSAWGRHVRQWMESHPGVKYREAQTQAKASYVGAKAKAPARARAPARAKPAPKPQAPKPTSGDPLEPWREHLSSHRSKNPTQTLKQAMQAAKVTY